MMLTCNWEFFYTPLIILSLVHLAKIPYIFWRNLVILAIVLKRPLRPALGRPVLKWAAIKQPFHRRKTYKEQKKDKCNQFTLFSVHRYRVSHFEMDFMNWLWQIKICKFDLVWRWFWNTEIGNFWVPQLFSKKVTSVGLNSLQQKGYQISVKNWIFDDPFHEKGPVLVITVPGII